MQDHQHPEQKSQQQKDEQDPHVKETMTQTFRYFDMRDTDMVRLICYI